MNRRPILPAFLALGVLVLASTGAAAQSVDQGDSGDIAAKAAVTVSLAGDQADSGDLATKGAQGEWAEGGAERGDPAPDAVALSSDDAPTWAGKSVSAGSSDTGVVATKSVSAGDGDSTVMGAAKSRPELAGDDRVEAGAKAAPAGDGDDSRGVSSR